MTGRSSLNAGVEASELIGVGRFVALSQTHPNLWKSKTISKNGLIYVDLL